MSNEQWIEHMEKTLAEVKKQDARLKAGVRCSAPKLRASLKEVSNLCRSGRQDALARGKAIPKKAPKSKKTTAEPPNDAVSKPE